MKNVVDVGNAVKARFKVWLEKDGSPVLGEGGARLLMLVDETGSLREAARRMGVSYTFAWNYIHKREKLLGFKLIESARGGIHGGETVLTAKARELLDVYNGLVAVVSRAVEEYCARRGLAGSECRVT